MTGARGSAAAQPSLRETTTVRSGRSSRFPTRIPPQWASTRCSSAVGLDVEESDAPSSRRRSSGRPAASAERVTLMVIDGNEPASKLYESCGFTYSGESERRERDGAVELAMARVIRTAR